MSRRRTVTGPSPRRLSETFPRHQPVSKFVSQLPPASPYEPSIRARCFRGQRLEDGVRTPHQATAFPSLRSASALRRRFPDSIAGQVTGLADISRSRTHREFCLRFDGFDLLELLA